MYNYHTSLVWTIDKILLFSALLLSVTIIFLVMIKGYLWKRRSRALLKIKKDVYGLILSGQQLSDNVCMPLAADITIRQFLDVTTNRNREAIFFNETEQKIFKYCFILPEQISRMEKMAKKGHSKWHRIEAILSLGYAHADSTLETLTQTLNSRDEDISYFSIIALGQIKNADSAKILLDFLQKRIFCRAKIISILESFPAGIADEAAKLLIDVDPDIRSWAAILLAKLKAIQYVNEVEGLTQDESEEVRAAACECLGEFGKKESKETLIKCLEDEFWLVREQAVEALSDVLGKDCLPEIIKMINDPSLSVIDAVKDVIIEHIDAAMPYIEKFLSGTDEVAKRTAREALDLSGRRVNKL